MHIYNNMVISRMQDGKESVSRVICPEKQPEYVYLFDVNDPHALHIRYLRSQIIDELSMGIAHVTELRDTKWVYHDDDLGEKYIQRREAIWNVIKPLLFDDDGNINTAMLESKTRGPLIAKRALETGRKKKVLYAWWRQCCRGGMIRNAVIPQWHRCGSTSSSRKVRRKLGRPSDSSRQKGTVLGINIDEQAAEMMIKGYRLFFEKGKRANWQTAYLRTMAYFYNQGHELIDGTSIPILRPADERPTLAQFRYHCRKMINADPKGSIVRRKGERHFETNHRPLLGNSTHMAFGPLFLAQVDATVGDIYLVSAINRRWSIGRPIIYLVVDVFSRMIIGMSVSLEGPSWQGAMLAMQNVVEDKVEFCARYGIPISHDLWPTAYLPHAVLADRGEFEGQRSSDLTNVFGVNISNTAPYRADWKGIVERDFRTLNDLVIHWLPGSVVKRRERGERDYRLDACFTLYEFRQIMIRHILYHNNALRMDWYRRDEFAIQDEVDPYPIRLWNWGMENRTGTIHRKFSAEQLRLGLLPRAQASITPSGLLFEGVHYSGTYLEEQQLLTRTRQGRQTVPIAYDHSRPETIYLCIENGQRLEPCHVLPSETSFHGRNLDLFEIQDYFARMRINEQEQRTTDHQAQVAMMAHVDAIVDKAKLAALEARDGKKLNVRDMRDNRRIEQANERTSPLQDQPLPHLPKRSPAPQTISDYIPPPDRNDRIRRLAGIQDGEEQNVKP